MKDEFWYVSDDDGKKLVYIYTKQYKKIGLGLDNELALYYNEKTNKLEAVQYVVEKDSDEYKRMVKLLNLSEKDRYIEKRTRKKKK